MITPTHGDWRDGFLFVGNHLALDFLNTRPVMNGQPVELLPDCAALARWLAAAGLVAGAQSARLKQRWSTASMDEIRKVREHLRAAVLQMEAGDSPSRTFIKELNRLLRAYPYSDQVVGGQGGLERRYQFAPNRPEEVFAPLADAIADLVVKAPRARLRKCRSCVLHFCDTSKKGTRIWCSMNLCGNRAKVAAFAGRKRRKS